MSKREVVLRTVKWRLLPMLAVAVATIYGVTEQLSEPRLRYLTLNPSLTQQFVSVEDERAIQDLCFRLQAVHGVTGVSYRDYSPASQSAFVTVFFDPHETSVRQIRIFMLHTKILWQREMNV